MNNNNTTEEKEEHIINDINIFQAVKKKNINKVKEYINNNGDVNIKDNYRLTPLLYAAEKGHHNIVECLVANGADVNIQNNGGLTPLHFAAYDGHPFSVEYLIANGADVNIKDATGGKPLDLAFYANNIKAVKRLLPLTNLTNVEDSYNLYKSILNTEVEGKAVISELIMNREYERFFTFCELFSIGTNPVEDDNKKQEKNSLMIGYDAPLDVNEEEEVRPFPPMFDSNLDESLFDVTLVGEIWDYARDFLSEEEINNYEE